ncbi:retron Ec48 family effector membrane protein [Alcaligenes sp. A-TC2]|uniref:retron Ec48 family effector membrane protein n=1 Tax=Alcaligenes TaxID=507 RepID=UPI000E1967DD|nr:MULTISPECIES: retron Ec48 family effector membrane protein [Alcaligenes]MCX5471619.1 retron Ec48 family effector membrane protein [Alcaligenes nematophilus]SUU82393.1 Uncharacterised protein [Alcaligenes faecalis subsp. faecalis]
MSKKIKRIGKVGKWVDQCIDLLVRPRTLFVVPFLVFALFFSLALAYFALIGFGSGIFYQKICFSTACIDEFKGTFSPVYDFISAFAPVVVALVTILAAFAAVHTYHLSVKNNILANHIAHFDMFSDYLSGELEKLPRIDKKSIDGFRFFVFIFPDSREGNFSPSTAYIDFIDRLIDSIKLTEGKYSGKESEVFYSFKEHQNRVRQLVAECGIELALKPNKTDFFKMEKEVYDLLQRVNECFCVNQNMKAIPKPSYS